MKAPQIHSENSAQGTDTRSNPMVRTALERVSILPQFGINGKLIVVDLGCGKLRHLPIYREYANHLILVDTPEQVRRSQKFAGVTCTMAEYIDSVKRPGFRISIIESTDFARRHIQADIAVCVAVMDVVLSNVREQIIDSAFRNLRRLGCFIVIVPRNDASILKRCNDGNKLSDGHFFGHPGQEIFTFYANFRDHMPLLRMAIRSGFELIQDISNFRQICLILQKP